LVSSKGRIFSAIDGSAVAMERLRERLKSENLEAFLGCGDFTKLEFKPDYFDCIIDVSSLCYVQKDKIEDVMKQLHTVLKPGGRFFSITPTNECAKPPFDHTIDGVSLKARFQTYDEAIKNFRSFNDLSISSYDYDVEKGRIHLWVITAEKEGE